MASRVQSYIGMLCEGLAPTELLELPPDHSFNQNHIALYGAASNLPQLPVLRTLSINPQETLSAEQTYRNQINALE